MKTKLAMKAHEGNLEPWFIEHGLHVTDEQRDILRGIVQERDRLKAINAELLAALELMVAEYGDYHAPVKPCVTQARAAIARAKG